jgi:ABC-type transport system involved in cytochrome bd biosynthesis fused ATPase/permease subunit
MDESTSSLDYATDQKIQTTIREEFEEALTITVAHRIRELPLGPGGKLLTGSKEQSSTTTG